MNTTEWMCEKHGIKGINPLGCYRCTEEEERGFCAVCGELGHGSYKGVIFCSPDCESKYFKLCPACGSEGTDANGYCRHCNIEGDREQAYMNGDFDTLLELGSP